MQNQIEYLISRCNKLSEMGQEHISLELLDILNNNYNCPEVVEILSETADDIIEAFDIISEEFYFQNINDEHRSIPRLVQGN